MKTIILYGMRGSGKSTVGKLLAKKLGYDFLDLDRVIAEKNNQKLSDYIDLVGWDKFRDEEYQCLKEILSPRNTGQVISLGGGTIAFERNREEVFENNNTKIIYLNTDLVEISRRILKDEESGDQRNSLTGKSVLEELEEVYKQREEMYKSSCDFSVDNNGRIEDTLEEIEKKLKYGGICIPIIDASNIDQIYAEIKNDRRIEYIELRLDLIFSNIVGDVSSVHEEMLQKIIQQSPKKVICTNRSHVEGGKFFGTALESVDFLQRCLEYGADYIDIELINYEKICRDVACNISTEKLILSSHNFEKTSDVIELQTVLERMNTYSPAVYKIAMMPKNKEDVKIIYDLANYISLNKGKDFQNENQGGFVFISMGKLGEQSRIDFPKMGGLLTFGTYGKSGSAPGQIEYTQLHTKIFTDKEVLFLGGPQISGSLSPFMHNLSSQMLEKEENKFVYRLYSVDPKNVEMFGKNISQSFIDFLESDEKYLGGNVTMPYKIEMFEYLYSLERLDKNAQLVGAVNTLYKKNGKIFGTNTDIDGVKIPIGEKLGKTIKEIKNCYILGAGGAARAAIAAMIELGIENIYVLNRSQEGLDEIEKHFREFLRKGQKIITGLYDVTRRDKLMSRDVACNISTGGKVLIINTLPFGFKEHLPKSPIDFKELSDIFPHVALYFEVVYDSNKGDSPIVREILRYKENDVKICRGIEMLIAQAKTGFELWTEGGEFQTEKIKQKLLK